MMNGIPWDYINKMRARYGMPKIDRDGKVKQKHIKSWKRRGLSGRMKDFTPLIISADDRAFLEAQAYNIAEISRCFGVSEAMACPMIELNGGPFDNIAKQYEKFLKDHVPEFRWKLYDRIPRKTKKRLKKTAFILFGKLVLTAHKRK